MYVYSLSEFSINLFNLKFQSYVPLNQLTDVFACVQRQIDITDILCLLSRCCLLFCYDDVNV